MSAMSRLRALVLVVAGLGAGGAFAQAPPVSSWQPLRPTLPLLGAPPLPGTWPVDRPRVEIGATSHFGGDQDFAPWRVMDGWASSLWCEGVEGPGLGEALTFHFDVPQRLARVEVQAGAMASSEHFLANDVPIGWELRTDAGARLRAKDTALTPVQTGPGPTGLTVFQLPEGAFQAFQLRLEGVLRKDGAAHACVSEVRLYREEQSEAEALSPVPLAARPYLALPGDLHRILSALQRCDEVTLGTHIRYPFTWDVEGASLAQPRARVTAVTTLEFHRPSELARTCRERPHEAPLAPSSTTLEVLLRDVVVESPERVAVTFPPSTPGEQGMRWWLEFRTDHWVLVELQR